MRALATAIFLKGYQWPFDPDRAADFGSSLIDILVEHERRDLGRRVWMDFTRNPMATGRLEPFSLSDLEPAHASTWSAPVPCKRRRSSAWSG